MTRVTFANAVLVATLLGGCQWLATSGSGTPPTTSLGDSASSFVQPLPGLSDAQVAQYQRGRALFDHTFTPAEGLGPLFNNTSCKACHGFPNSGGASSELLTLIGGDSNGVPRTLKEKGGPVISDWAIAGIPREQFPLAVTAISKRTSPPTFGTGLLEAVATADLTAQLAPDSRKDSLGIRGKANSDGGAIGRFGWKAQTADMLSFTVTAANFEMGLSSPQRPYEFFPNLPPQFLASPSLYASVSFVASYFDQRGAASASPDLTQAQVDDLTAFQRFQAPPAPLPLSLQAKAGQATFQQLGCALCHTPQFKTSPNAIGIPSGLAVNCYSDLLLHDMGPLLDDGIRYQSAAKGSEWRTTPLWGLRFKQRYLHDGRTNSLEEAIMLHSGEGAKVAAAYQALGTSDRSALLAFLSSL